jgi:alpha-L-fucosidase
MKSLKNIFADVFLLAIAVLFFNSSCCRPKKSAVFEPSIASIRHHECPEWFRDAKFGMFLDWGLYSIGGWAPAEANGATYPDWYMFNMLSGATKIHHDSVWGSDFMPDDFIPLFTAEGYDPEWYVELAKDAGMKYLIPFCKHHDGYCLWPSSFTGRDAVDMPPHRDLIRPLVDACNREGLKFGFYFSVEEWFYPIEKDGRKFVREWGGEMKPYDSSMDKIQLTGKTPVADFFADYIEPQAKEFIDLYDPDILWFDGDWTDYPETLRTPQIIAHFFNNAADRKEVTVNDRIGRIRFRAGDFFCSEYHALPEDYEFKHVWEENRGISQSFGYNSDDTEGNVLAVGEFIHLFIRTVSNNGNMLLIVSPDGSGALPKIQETRLREIGKWLKINGEAIYGSRPWLAAAQGDSIRFTQSKDGTTVYAICTKFPDRELTVNSVYLSPETGKVSMLGADDTPLEWEQRPDGLYTRLVVKIPESLFDKRKNDYAWTFKITL